MDVFTNYMFAQQLTPISVEALYKYLMQWLMQYSYILTLILSDQGTQFTSKMQKQFSSPLDFQVEHAMLKDAQTIGVVERSQGPLKCYLKICENQIQHDWHKHIDLAVFQHNKK